MLLFPIRIPARYRVHAEYILNAMRRTLLLIFVAVLTPCAFSDESSTIARFNASRRSEPELIAFLKNMPKGADLHNHVTGAIYSDFILDNAVKRGMYFDTKSNAFEANNAEGRVPAATLLTNNSLLYQYLNAVSMRGWTPNTVDGHDHFFDTFGIISSGNGGLSTEDLLAEVLRRNMAQNVQYMELMTTCAPWSEISKVVVDPPPVDSLEFAFETLRPKLAELGKIASGYMNDRDKTLMRLLDLKHAPGGSQGPINVRYIMQINRTGSNEQFFATSAAALQLVKSDRRIVALNIVAPEDHPNARNNFKMQMEMLDFLWKKLGKPNITLHAGELTLKYSPVEPMFARIRDSIEIGHARRIGHGVSVAWEHNLPELLAKMKREGILVEICLTSNRSILGVSGAMHPILMYRKAGVPVCLNTDDEGVSRSNLTMEWVKAVQTFGFSYRDLKEMSRNSLEYSFLPGNSLFLHRDYTKLRPEFINCRKPNWSPSSAAKKLLDGSEKMQIQLRLERAYVAFESK